MTPGRIRGWRATTSFLDVGTPRDYLRAALDRQGASTSARHDIPTSANVAGSFVWSRATIGRDVLLEECIVAGAVTLPPGFRARSAVVVPASVVRREDRAEVRDGVAIFPIDAGPAAP
jgi:NDP-sugar pyrophosphorylase family protein